MKVLVANLGSTSFKYRLLDMESETQLARGGIDRIGGGDTPSKVVVEIGDYKAESEQPVANHAEAVRLCLAQLTDAENGCLSAPSEVAAIGFKAVHGGRYSGVQRINDDVLAEMERMNPIAPAHNPPYIAAMRQLYQQLPEIPLVAAFETGFHQTIPDRHQYYAVPLDWAEKMLIKKWGFHGASHRYIATRTAELTGRDDLRIISCHLGGSSSISAIRDGKSVANSFGLSPQTGLPHNNRIGELDPFALPFIMRETGKSVDEVLAMLASEAGLAGVSGTSGDMRDVKAAIEAGSREAEIALEIFATSVRNYLGSYMVEMAGVDVIVFTGGIGEHNPDFREMVCANLETFGIELDQEANTAAQGEALISSPTSRVEIRVIPTNEELIVARQTKELLS